MYAMAHVGTLMFYVSSPLVKGIKCCSFSRFWFGKHKFNLQILIANCIIYFKRYHLKLVFMKKKIVNHVKIRGNIGCNGYANVGKKLIKILNSSLFKPKSNLPIMFPKAHTACSQTFWCGEWRSLKKRGTASIIKTNIDTAKCLRVYRFQTK